LPVGSSGGGWVLTDGRVTLGMGTGKLACTAATTWLAGCAPGGEMPSALSWAGLRLAS
jgi:hypothetical protein